MTSIRAWRPLAIFDSLQNRHFRWFWVGRLATSATFQMGSVAQGWLVYQLTGSALALGWVGSGWSIANSTLSLYGGVISDRIEKRRLLLWARGIMVLGALGITLVIAGGAVQVWHLAAYSLFRGILFAVLMPAQNAYMAELVDRRTLLNAVSLNSVGMGLAGIFASSAAGVLIGAVGIEAVYLGVAVLYAIAFLTLIRLPYTGRADPGNGSVWSDLREGLGYLRACPILVPLLGLVFARGLLAMPYRTFMPKYAQDVMGLDAQGLGTLMAAPGAGSLISSLVLASLGNFRGKGRLLLGSGIVLGLALVFFSNTPSFVLVLVFLVVVGAMGNVCMVTNQTLLQVNCDPQFRGRVMSMYMMMFGLTQLGTIPAGAVADRLGVSFVLTLEGGLFTAVFALMWLLLPKVRRLE
jgi:MFS family permease